MAKRHTPIRVSWQRPGPVGRLAQGGPESKQDTGSKPSRSNGPALPCACPPTPPNGGETSQTSVATLPWTTGQGDHTHKTLWRVERAFRDLKSSLEIRPVYVWTDEHVRGHVAVCFLVFVLESYLRHKLGEAVSYRQALTDLEKLKAVPLQIKGKRYLLRTELEGTAPAVFRILGIRPPNRVEELSSTPAA